ncbi:hypothetical protein Tco_0097538 [Tanacetum coccineum]
MIIEGEYDLWSMKMRQYIAITDHILWDIITNGDQATTDPLNLYSSSVFGTNNFACCSTQEETNEKPQNYCFLHIPDNNFLSFHDAEDAKTYMVSHKRKLDVRSIKEDAKESFETTIRDCPIEDANLSSNKPTICVAWCTKSSSQNIAFLSTEIKGSTLKQSTADPDNIPKGYTQAASSKVQTAPNCASHSDEINGSFFAQQASYAYKNKLMMMKTCCKLMKMHEEIDIR